MGLSCCPPLKAWKARNLHCNQQINFPQHGPFTYFLCNFVVHSTIERVFCHQIKWHFYANFWRKKKNNCQKWKALSNHCWVTVAEYASWALHNLMCDMWARKESKEILFPITLWWMFYLVRVPQDRTACKTGTIFIDLLTQLKEAGQNLHCCLCGIPSHSAVIFSVGPMKPSGTLHPPYSNWYSHKYCICTVPAQTRCHSRC